MLEIFVRLTWEDNTIDYSSLPAKRLTGHTIFVPVKQANAAGFQVKHRLLATGHFPAVALAAAGEAPASLDR